MIPPNMQITHISNKVYITCYLPHMQITHISYKIYIA